MVVYDALIIFLLKFFSCDVYCNHLTMYVLSYVAIYLVVRLWHIIEEIIKRLIHDVISTFYCFYMKLLPLEVCDVCCGCHINHLAPEFVFQIWGRGYQERAKGF